LIPSKTRQISSNQAVFAVNLHTVQTELTGPALRPKPMVKPGRPIILSDRLPLPIAVTLDQKFRLWSNRIVLNLF
jgi:hypothetical protein